MSGDKVRRWSVLAGLAENEMVFIPPVRIGEIKDLDYAPMERRLLKYYARLRDPKFTVTSDYGGGYTVRYSGDLVGCTASPTCILQKLDARLREQFPEAALPPAVISMGVDTPSNGPTVITFVVDAIAAPDELQEVQTGIRLAVDSAVQEMAAEGDLPGARGDPTERFKALWEDALAKSPALFPPAIPVTKNQPCVGVDWGKPEDAMATERTVYGQQIERYAGHRGGGYVIYRAKVTLRSPDDPLQQTLLDHLRHKLPGRNISIRSIEDIPGRRLLKRVEVFADQKVVDADQKAMFTEASLFQAIGYAVSWAVAELHGRGQPSLAELPVTPRALGFYDKELHRKHDLRPPSLSAIRASMAPGVKEGHPEFEVLQAMAAQEWSERDAAWRVSLDRIQHDAHCECSARGAVGKKAGWSHAHWCPSAVPA